MWSGESYRKTKKFLKLCSWKNLKGFFISIDFGKGAGARPEQKSAPDFHAEYSRHRKSQSPWGINKFAVWNCYKTKNADSFLSTAFFVIPENEPPSMVSFPHDGSFSYIRRPHLYSYGAGADVSTIGLVGLAANILCAERSTRIYETAHDTFISCIFLDLHSRICRCLSLVGH